MALLHDFNNFTSLYENKAQAEKILREKGVDLTDEDYVNLKNILAENQNIGYLGLFVTLIYKGRASYEDIYTLYDEIKEAKPYLNDLPQNLLLYTSITQLRADMEHVRQSVIIKKYIKKNIHNRDLKQDLLNHVQDASAATELATSLKKLEELGKPQ